MVIKQRAPDQKNPFASKCMLENKVALPIAFEHHGLLLLEVIEESFSWFVKTALLNGLIIIESHFSRSIAQRP
jgi:hypothetical protein